MPGSFKYLLSSLVCLSVLIVSCQDEIPVEPVHSDLTVKVVDEDSNPVNTAEVRLGVTYREFTNSEGICIFKDLSEGQYKMYVKAHDFVDSEKEVMVSGMSPSYLVTLTAVPPYVETDSLLIRTYYPKDSFELHLRSNTDWKVVPGSPELSFNRTEGHGDGIVVCSWDFKVDSLVDVDKLEASFSIQGAGTEKLDFGIRLAVPIRVIHTEGTVPNLVKDPDGLCKAVVVFSRKVKDVQVYQGYEYMDVEQLDDYTVTFPVHGKEHLLYTYNVDLISAKSANGDGVVFHEYDISVPFDDGEVYMDGNIVGIELSRDEKTFWASVTGNKLRKIDARTLEVLKEIDVPFEAGPLSFNPFNGLLYVIDSYQGYGKSVRVIDPETGEQIKSIVIEPDEDDLFHHDTVISPRSIKVAENGVGAVIVTRQRLRIIDSRDGDKVRKHPYLDLDLGPYFDIYEHDIRGDIMLDHTGNRFITTGYIVQNRVVILNTEDEGGEHFLLDDNLGGDYGGGHIWIFKPHPQRPIIYVTKPYCEGIYDVATHSYSKPFSPTPGWNSVGDYCYGEPFGDDLCTYLFFKGDFFIVLNHTSGEIVYHANIRLYTSPEQLFSFQEGDRILFYLNTGGKTKFVRLNTSRFM